MLCYIFAVLLTLCVSVYAAEVNTYSFEHSFDGGATWQPRGPVSLQFGGSSSSSRVATASFDEFVEGSTDETPVKIDAAALEDLAEKGDFYRVRLSDNKGMTWSTFCPACALLDSGFREFFTFQVDAHGHLLSFDYQTSVADCVLEDDFIIRARQDKLTSRLAVRPKGRVLIGKAGDKPKDVRSAKEQVMKEADKKANPVDERGFFAKYWFYIIIAVFWFLSKAAPEPPAAAK